LVAAASVASTALYFYDYAFGFTVLLALSLVHIVLEFPARQFGFCASWAPPSDGRDVHGLPAHMIAKPSDFADWPHVRAPSRESIIVLFRRSPSCSTFLPLFFVGYCVALGTTAKNLFLLIASLVFYAWGEPWFVVVLIGRSR